MRWKWTGGGEVVKPPWYWVKQWWRWEMYSGSGLAVLGSQTGFDPVYIIKEVGWVWSWA